MHAVSHVHYGMMMIASAVRVGEITGDIQPVAGPRVNQGVRPASAGASTLCASLCTNGGWPVDERTIPGGNEKVLGRTL